MVVDIFGVIVAIVLGSILYYYFCFIDNLMDKVLGSGQVLYYRKDNSLDSIPHNAKSKTTTKKRWAKSTHQVPNDSFASAIMWGDLGND